MACSRPFHRQPAAPALLLVGLVAGASAVAAAAGPVSPADAPATLALPADLTATLFAAEPLLSSPADIDVDSAGRVWVCEVTNYRGKKDTRPDGDRILVLEDTTGDGVADKQTVFHQGRDVDSALGICVIGEGKGRKVIVSCAPEVLVFHDDDGDLVADRREVLFTKTGQPQHDHSVHAFVVGPDGHWYFNFGNTGRAVHGRDGKPVVDRLGNVVNDSGKPYRQGMVFRCRPDGSDFEVLGHNFRNNYEVAVDSFGGLWQSDNDDDGNRGVRINAVIEHGNYGYVDERSGAGWQAGRTNLEPEIPQRHWHQNDPGVMPNLLLTGAGSPTGICVYEGSLLPERFQGALIHCDAGPNVVRAYPVSRQGAGYTARIEPLVDGSADRWFRPSDVCVAPDGSLIVADWYDPGVGGHGMGDTERGRIYRIAPPGAAWQMPHYDFGSLAGCVAALASPNLSARATALERLAAEPAAAAPLLGEAFGKATDPRHRARLAWAAGMLPGQAEAWVARLAAEADENLRLVAIRLCRRVEGDVLGLVERLASDPSPAVRREAVISLKGLAGKRADRAWAELAARHTAGDRWEVEALGIGADGAAGLAGEPLAARGAKAAAAAISACPWGDVRQAAAEVLPLPKARGGASLPPVAELVKRKGDAKAGRAVFAGTGTCGKCHVVNGEGKSVGPDLSEVGAKLSPLALYESILAPSAAISHNYETWTAITEDGRSFSGLLVSKTDEAIVIRAADGVDVSLAAAEIDELVRQPISLMPADLATVLTEQELVDLVAWLGTLKGRKEPGGRAAMTGR